MTPDVPARDKDRYGPSASMPRAALTEVIGTFYLVFAGTAVATAAILAQSIAGAALNSLAVGLAFGLVLAALVNALGHVSGCHLNPAVTIGLASAGRFPWKFVPAYIIAQLLGAILAGAAVLLAFGTRGRELASLGATYPAPGVSTGQAFVMEALITFLLVLVITSIGTDERAPKSVAGLSIGSALAVGVLIGGPVTGGAVNPARALGPMIVAGKYTGAWIYIVAPIIGGILAALIYDWVMARTGPPK